MIVCILNTLPPIIHQILDYFAPLGDSVPVVRWLLEQRNANGGFISTQDTVVGLAALARFARYTRSASTEMSIDITYEGGTKSFQINSNNAIVLQEFQVHCYVKQWATLLQ